MATDVMSCCDVPVWSPVGSVAVTAPGGTQASKICVTVLAVLFARFGIRTRGGERGGVRHVARRSRVNLERDRLQIPRRQITEVAHDGGRALTGALAGGCGEQRQAARKDVGDRGPLDCALTRGHADREREVASDTHRIRGPAQTDLRIAACRERECADAGAPVELSRAQVVLLRVPEGASVGIDGHGAIVAPPMLRADLRAQALVEPFSQGHLAQRIARPPGRVGDCRVAARAGEGVPESDVPGTIHGNAAHPAVFGIGRVGGLLVDRGSAVGIANLVPADAGVLWRSSHVHGVVGQKRFVSAEIAVGEAVHQPVGDGIQSIG